MKVFVTGAAGYIGGAVASALRASGHDVVALVRSPQKADHVRALGFEPALGTLDDGELLARLAASCDAVIDTANAEHAASVEALLTALAGSGKPFIRTSGSSVVGDLAWGEGGGRVFEDDTPFEPGPGRAARVAIDRRVRAAARDGVRSAVILPSLIYGPGRDVEHESSQVPRFFALARKYGVARHVGRGENQWSNVHIDDLADLYLRVLAGAPAGALYYAANGENSMRELAESVSRALGFGGRTRDMSREESVAEFGEGPAAYTYGSNSRVRSVRARRELGWAPRHDALLSSIDAAGGRAQPA
ncbi:MAG: NAD-dependent epimerase/dehydratase family protein [Burkholderiales bacterium]